MLVDEGMGREEIEDAISVHRGIDSRNISRSSISRCELSTDVYDS